MRIPEGMSRIDLQGRTMGTNWSAKLYVPAGISKGLVADKLEVSFRDCIQVFSLWDEASFINRFNSASFGDTICIPDEFRHVWQAAFAVYEASRGAFDPYCHDEISRRGFNPPIEAYVNPPQNLKANPFQENKAVLAKPRCPRIDLNAIAKGYAVDCMASVLEGLRVFSYLVEIGGEYKGIGCKEDGQPWWVEIETGNSVCVLNRVAMTGLALATSGNFYKNKQVNSHPAGHILNPANAAGDIASVSVIHPSCMHADAWATALFASGEGALGLSEKNEISAIIQLKSGSYLESLRLKSHFLGK